MLIVCRRLIEACFCNEYVWIGVLKIGERLIMLKIHKQKAAVFALMMKLSTLLDELIRTVYVSAGYWGYT